MRVTILAAILLLAAGGASAQEQPAPPAKEGAPPADAAPAPDVQPAAPAPPAPSNPPMTGPKLLISTSMGDITLQLDSVRAPRSVANVLRYVKEKHYDGTAFYRVAKGFVIQMGSWDGNGKGRGIHPGPVPLEANNGLSNLRGTVAMGRGDAPDSATAEFFINLADNTPLDHKPDDPGNATGYAVFGQVIAGMDVVDAISQVPVGDNGPMPGQAPVTPVVVKKVTLLK
ncbi:MAG TPA: peptidylprolyl isomerase [Rhizomicrobium sp.]|jgi:cyclophilin family peptidyl-prolyl cis-trans isomerase|nr:peptidylprolyl isomerase [Rhizomicrobium sp.]